MTDFVAPIRSLDSRAQPGRALDLAEIVAPYGTLDTAVVEAATFVALLSRLRADTPGAVEAAAVENECEAIIERFDEEPVAPGFYAFGAVVALHYASEAVQGNAEAAVNCAKRFLDLLGRADDEGESGLFDAAVSYLARPSPDERRLLAARVQAHADSMR
jgi:hypothetical protein